MYVNKSLTKSFWNIKLKPLQCPFSLCLKALIPFQPGSPKQYFPLGSSEPCVVVASHHCDHWRKLRHLCTRADCSFGFALSAIRSIRSRQNWGVCCRNDVRLRLFHLGHGLMHDMGSIDPFPLVLLVRAGAWFAVFGKSTTPCILMAGTWNKSQKHLTPVASSQSSLRSFVSVEFVDFHVQLFLLQFFSARNVWGANVHISSASLTWKMTFKQFRWFTVKSQTQWVSQITAPVTQFDALIKLKHASCSSFDFGIHVSPIHVSSLSMFSIIFLHVSIWFPCRVHQATGVLQWAPCRKQPSLWANRAELPMRKKTIFVGQKCKSQVLQPLFAFKQSGPRFFVYKKLVSCCFVGSSAWWAFKYVRKQRFEVVFFNVNVARPQLCWAWAMDEHLIVNAQPCARNHWEKWKDISHVT